MKNAKVCDLHTHSYYSDGELSPKELVREAKKKGIKILALADHNSVGGVQEAIDEGSKIGVRVIPGVEIKARGTEVLGYFVDYKNKELKRELKRSAHYGNEKTNKRLKRIQELGIEISLSKVLEAYPEAKDNFNTGHIIYYLTKKGFTQEKIYHLIDKTRIKPPKKKDITVVSAIKLIKKHNGVPVLAHPWIGEYTKELKFNEKNIKKFVKAGLKGLEINNGEGYRFKRTPQFVKKIRKFAKKYNLILTSGSDYHGNAMFGTRSYHCLGKYNCSEEIVKQLEKLKEE